MILFATLLAAYLIGSLPTAVIVAKRVAGINILQHGSGNPGASNVFRLLGPRWASATFGVDVLKGYMPVVLAGRFSAELLHPVLAPTPLAVMAWVGFAAFLGHCFSPFLRFKGGKGAATGLGAMFALAPHTITVAIFVYAAALFFWKTFSLATLLASLAFPVLLYFFEGQHHPAAIAWGALVPLLMLLTHRKNLARIVKGTELKMSNPVGKEEDE